MHIPGPVLIAYDGSEDSRHAITEAAGLIGGGRAVVLYARQPLESVSAHLEGHPDLERVREIDEYARDSAERLAAEGADHARVAGFDADPRVVNSTGSPGEAIVHVADDLDAALIVMGSRGRRGLKSLLLGSVSHHVSHQARRPTLIVPAPALAEARRRAGQDLAEPAVAQ